MDPCLSTCPHGITTCDLPAGHPGNHEVSGESVPGRPAVVVCEWRGKR